MIVISVFNSFIRPFGEVDNVKTPLTMAEASCRDITRLFGAEVR